MITEKRQSTRGKKAPEKTSAETSAGTSTGKMTLLAGGKKLRAASARLLFLLILCMGMPMLASASGTAASGTAASGTSASGTEATTGTEKAGSRVRSGRKNITVTTGDNTFVYRRYAEQNNSGYLQRQGCVHTAVSIAASAFGKYYTPTKIYGAKASRRYGEKYAVRKLKTAGKNINLAGKAAITVTLAGQILEDMGIPVSVQYSVSYRKTYRQIREHLEQGLPVIVKCQAVTYKGTKFTTAHHAIVLVGIDADGYLIFIDSWNGSVNKPAMSGNNARLTLREFIRNFMFEGSKEAKQPYVGTMSAAGGYILVA